MNLGQLIKKNRELQNLSMNELARRAGMAQSGVGDIETGKRQPTFDILERIIAVFNMTLSEFFSDEQPEYPSYIRELIKSVQGLTPNQIELLNHFLISLQEPSSSDSLVYYPGTDEPLAAHRTDNCTDKLPVEAINNVREFQHAYLAEDASPHPKKRKKNSKKSEPAE